MHAGLKRLNDKGRILVIDNSRGITGAIKAAVLTSQLMSDRHDFIFVLPVGSTATEYVRQSGYEVINVPMIEISKRLFDLLFYMPRLVINAYILIKVIKKRSIDIIHMNDYYNLLGVLCKLFTEVKLVTHVRRLPNSMPTIFSRMWLMLADKFAYRLICVSYAVKWQVKSKKAIVIYDSYSLEERYPEKKIKSEGRLTFLYLANYIQGKGQDLALQAFVKAHHENKNLRLKYVGDTLGLKKNINFRLSLENKVKSMGLNDVITFHEFSADIENEIKKADVMLNFSEGESFSLTCLESLVYGTPMIATDCGGPSEIIENGISGYLVENRNVNEMTDVILKLSYDLEKRRDISLAGKMRVKQKFSKTNTKELLNRVYYDILK